MWREMIIFADTQTINQVTENSKAEATLSTVVCGQSGSGPITIVPESIIGYRGMKAYFDLSYWPATVVSTDHSG